MYILNIATVIRKKTFNSETLSLKAVINELDFLTKIVIIQ